MNTFAGPSSTLQWNMLLGRGSDNGTLNVTLSELGTTLGASGQYGYVSIPQTMWNGMTNEWVTKPWFDESEISPPKFYSASNRGVFNTKLVQ